MGLFKSLGKVANSTIGKISGGLGLGSLFGDTTMADALRQQNEIMLQQQQQQLNTMRQQSLLDASNASAQVASVTTGDTLTVADNIKKRKQVTGSVSSSLGL